MFQADITSFLSQTAFYAGLALGFILSAIAAFVGFKSYSKHDLENRAENRKEIQQLKDENRKLQIFYENKIIKIQKDFAKQSDKFIENYENFSTKYHELLIKFQKYFGSQVKAE